MHTYVLKIKMMIYIKLKKKYKSKTFGGPTTQKHNTHTYT